MRKALIAILLLVSLISYSQKIIINGFAPGAERQTIQLSCPSDLLTNVSRELGRATIGDDGKFELKFTIPEITPATLSIGYHNTDLFLEPGMGYNVELKNISYEGGEEEPPFMRSEDLQLRFRDADTAELNFVLQRLNILYDNFLLKNYNSLLRDRNKALIDTFRNAAALTFPEIKNLYVKTCVRYKTAALEILAQAHSQSQIIHAYFTDSPVQYENVEYMDVFNQLFAKYFWVTSRVLKFKDYNAIITGPESYAKMIKILGEDTLLKNKQLRELVLLKGLGELYYQQGFDQHAILQLLQSVNEKSTFPESKVIAANMISLLTHLKPDTPAPDFSLTGLDEKEISLKDLNGKPVLISFWAMYCEPCLSDMESMADLYKKYRGRMYFVSISADKEFVRMKYFLSMKKDFSWIFLFLGGEVDVLKSYDIKSLPDYVLLDAQGKIVACPAQTPSTGLEQELEKLVQP